MNGLDHITQPTSPPGDDGSLGELSAAEGSRRRHLYQRQGTSCARRCCEGYLFKRIRYQELIHGVGQTVAT